MVVRYKTVRARKMLRAIDHNYQFYWPEKFDESGDIRYSSKYNQHTKHWDVAVQKCDKDYAYIPILLAKIFKMRQNDWNGQGPFVLAHSNCINSQRNMFLLVNI